MKHLKTAEQVATNVLQHPTEFQMTIFFFKYGIFNQKYWQNVVKHLPLSLYFLRSF